jgi:ABC-2 type transport system permease protein
MIRTIAQFELLKLFKTGKIWTLLAASQLFLGFIFYALLREYQLNAPQYFTMPGFPLGITEKVIHPFLAWTTLFFFLITTLLATQTLTQERKSQTLNLYLTSGLSPTHIILGKFLGIFLAEFFLLLPVLIMPWMICITNSLDIGHFLTGLLGLLLLQATTLSLAFLMASFSKEPLLAAMMIFMMLFLSSLLEWMGRFLSVDYQWIIEFSLLYHCKNFLSGVIDSRDVIYYSFFTSLFLCVSILRLKREAWMSR